MVSVARKDKAKLIRHEVAKYLSKKGNSCHFEVGLNKWGKLRADVFAFSFKRSVTVVEVKSGWSDYSTDSKWKGYLAFCNKMYLAVASDFPLKPEFLDALKQNGVGLLVVNLDLPSERLKRYHSSSVTCQLNAKSRKVEGEVKRDILVRLAYRNGMLRTNKNNWLNQVKDLL
jgi:hypothetical protein